ncbi:ATP-binding cassette domain-containing protein [Richelia sinica]|uniref:ATP-binding cassette domain-containing protein n=1 Tax=Richelia sinica TaxID=1357545 RepID=UPI001682498A|nr:ATP-binding cassette domain-containing protein [Richelia sinica]MBD2663966.1 ATP-binding cassette domain-containing protein [Richelia sinica FACHB-800]
MINRTLLRFAKPYPLLIIFTILLGFSGALFNGVSTALIVPVILKIVGQDINLKGAPPILTIMLSPFDQVAEVYRIGVMSAAIIFTIALKNLASYASSLTSSYLTKSLTADMREAGVKLLLNVDIEYYSRAKIGDLINRLGVEIGRASSYISSIIKIIILVITSLVLIGVLISISWQLTIASTLLLGVVTLVNQAAINRSRKFGRQLSKMSTAYSVNVLETLNGIRLVKSTGNEDREYKKISGLIRAREKADFQAQINSEAINPIGEVMGITALLVIVFLSKTFFVEQISSLSTVLLTYLLVLLRVLPIISQLNSIRSSLASSATSVDMATEFLNLENKPFMGNGKLNYSDLQQGVHFQSVSFGYPHQHKLVLKDVDLYIPKSTTLALVGGSGAGKSTLADLLARFYDPTGGHITFDGKDLKEFDLKTVRKRMGIVSQDTFLFNDSVRNNIAYGKPEATDEEIITAAKRANAYEFISKLPQQFDTMIGDRGVMLSGGQRQRLAIARAILQNPDILILDEATSALDTVSERLVQEALEELSRDRTTLVIAHRLSTVQKADQIAVLDKGQVVEVGTHNELLQKNGPYFQLYSMQFTDQPRVTPQPNSSLKRISHELRNRLNAMIGFLKLLIDDLVDDHQEKQKSITEAYKLSLFLLNSIDILDDIVALKQKVQLLPNKQPTNGDNQDQNELTNVCEEFRMSIYPLSSSLKLLADNCESNSQVEHKLLTEAYQAAVEIMKTLENFENKFA